MNKRNAILSIIMLSFLIQATHTKQAYAVAAVVSDPVNTGVSTFNKVINGVMLGAEEIGKPIVKGIAERVLQKITNDTLNWANGGFQDGPGFINNFDDFLRGTEHEILSESFKEAEDRAKGLGVAALGDLQAGVSAEINNQINQSGVLRSARTVAAAIALQGSRDLNFKPVTSIINGDQETLTKITGSQTGKDQFKGDIVKGGLVGFTSLIVPENTDVGLQSAITQAINAEKAEDINNIITDLNLPTKFLSKTSCDGREDADGKCLGREIVETPGDLVGSQVRDFLKGDKDQAINADGLIGPLIESIGAITDGLIDSGFSQITNNVSSSLFSGSDQVFSSTTDLRSEFDVLGIDLGTSNREVSVGGDNRQNNIFTEEFDEQFIGGPEDTSRPFNQRPQIIINLQEKLDKNIKQANTEFEIYQNTKKIAQDAASTAVDLDQCIPGPDFGWEQRYKDNFNREDHHRISLKTTKDMINDPLVNIPGTASMRSSLNQIITFRQTEENENGGRRTTLNSLRPTLESIKESINNDLNEQTSNITEKLFLYEDEWGVDENGNLTPTQQERIALAELVSSPPTSQDGNTTSSPYLLLKRNDDGEAIETPTSVLENEPNRVRDAVINLSWDIWRNETPLERKTLLRSSFFSVQNDLSNDQYLTIARAKERQVVTAATNAVNQLNDCLIFKAYAMGTIPENELRAEILDNPQANRTAQQKLRSQIDKTLGIIDKIAIFNPSAIFDGIFGSASGNVVSGTIDNAPSREELLDFIERQRNLFNSRSDQALFRSSDLISAAAVQNSILGFSTQAETDQYFKDFYPDGSEPLEPGEEPDTDSDGNLIDPPLPDSLIYNATTVARIFSQDRVFNSWSRQRGVRGVLFCRNIDRFDIQSGKDNTHRTTCLFDWYLTPAIEYQAAFTGISI